VCRILDGDLFAAISSGKVDVVTDEIDTFTPRGIRTRQGTEIDADVIVTATGFDLTVFGEVAFSVDGEPVDFARCVTYRGILFTGVPNMAWSFGALRLSWTMRIELVSRYVCRLLAHMDDGGATSVVPRLRPDDADMELTPFVDPAPVQSWLPGAVRGVGAEVGRVPRMAAQPRLLGGAGRAARRRPRRRLPGLHDGGVSGSGSTRPHPGT